MKKSILIIIGLIIVAVLAVVFANRSVTQTEPAPVVRVGYLPGLLGMPHIVAQSAGLYENAGVIVESHEFQSSNQLYDALVRGDIDIAPEFSAMPVLINHIKYPGMVKIFTTSRYNSREPFDQIVVSKNSPILSMGDLVGKKIGVFPGSTAIAFLKAFFVQQEMDISTIEFVQIPPPNQLQALESGSIDALYAYAPNISYCIIKFDCRVIGEPIFSSFLEESPIGIGTVSTQFLSKYPKLSEKIISAYDRTFEFYISNEKETRNILVDDMKIDPDVAQHTALIHQVQSYQIDRAHFQQFVDVLIQIGELPSQPDLSTLFYK